MSRLGRALGFAAVVAVLALFMVSRTGPTAETSPTATSDSAGSQATAASPVHRDATEKIYHRPIGFMGVLYVWIVSFLMVGLVVAIITAALRIRPRTSDWNPEYWESTD
jgi:hypothetical protein